MKITKYLRYYLLSFKMTVMEQMAFRENFWLWSIVHAVSLISSIVFFKVIYSQSGQVNGWSQYQVLLVLGVGNFLTGLGSLTFFPFMYRFGRDVAKGDFDLTLVKPIDPHFQAAFGEPDIEDISVVPISLILIVYAVLNLNTPIHLVNLILFLVLIISSLVILFSVLTLIESLAFKFIQVDAARDFYWSLVNVTKFPAKALSNINHLVSILVLPIALISSVPAEVIFGRIELNWILGSILLSFGLLVTSRYVFMTSLKHYSSASS